MKTKNIPPLLALVAGSLLTGALPGGAQELYSENFDTDVTQSGTWAVNVAANSPADLFFDYSTVGIPSAPNSTGGTTRGVKLNANLGPTGAFPGGVSVSPLGFNLPVDGNWAIYCDWWINFNGPAPGGGSGSTQLGGVGYGTVGSSSQVIGLSDSLFFVASGEGGSGDDYRAYSGAMPSSLQLASGAYIAGSRNNTASYYATNFLGQTCPAAQVALYAQQSGTTAAGAQGWKWRAVKIEKIGPYVTWSIDGIPLMVVDATTNGIAGDKLLLTHSDINATSSTDPNAPALAFSLFDNLRVSNIVANVVTVSASAAQAFEVGSSPGVFTFTRSITGAPLTVNYTIGGTASNGTDYVNFLGGGALSGSITFAAGDSTTNITFVPADDSLSEPLETVVLAVANGVGYVAAGSASATIADNDAPYLIVSAGSAGSMFERHTNDYASVKLTRWGDTSVPATVEAANFTHLGPAVLNVDYVVNSNLFPFSIDPGITETNINLVSPLDNNAYTGNKIITVGLAAGGGISVASSNASLTIIDDENPPATVLYSNPLDNPADAVNWGVTYANGDLATYGGTDYEAAFGYDLVADPLAVGPISLPPGGATKALRATVNKVVASNAGLNLYPTNVSFSGDYAVRFNMNIIVDTAGGTTQGPLFGINHDGKQTNWFAGSGAIGGPWASDGVWYWISADGGAAAGDYILHTGLGGALPNTGWTRPIAAGLLDNFINIFKGPPAPYSGYGGPGLVGNDPPSAGGDTRNWTDVEIKQIGTNVSLYLNKVKVLTYNNNTTFKSGTLMLGYSDPFNSVGNAPGAVYYANLSVVRITPPVISRITRSASNVTINFTSPDGTDSVSTLKLQKATLVTGPYADDNSAVITQLPDGTYQATTTSAEATQFFRIRKQ